MPPLIAQPHDDTEIDLPRLWATIWRHRWVILIGAILGIGAGVATILLVAPKYQAVASVRVDEGPAGSTMLDMLQMITSGATQIETEAQVLQSRTLAELTVDSLALQAELISPRHVSRTQVLDGVRVTDPLVSTVYSMTRTADSTFNVRDVVGDSALKQAVQVGRNVSLPGVEFRLTRAAVRYPELQLRLEPRSDVIKTMMEKTLEIAQPDKNANVLTVTYTGTDSVLVRDVPNLVTALFISQRQTYAKSEARGTASFLRVQLDTLGIQLRHAEDTLQAYRQQEDIVAPATQGGDELQYAINLEAQRTSVSMEHDALARLMSRIHSEQTAHTELTDSGSAYRQLLGFPSILKSQAAGQLLAALATLEDQKTQLLTRRKEADPDVQTLESQIQNLEQQIGNLGDTYVQALARQEQSLDSTLTTLGALLSTVPAKEIGYARLARQAMIYEVIDTLLQTKLQESQIAAAVDDQTARIVDHAYLPGKPVSPNKPLVMALSVLLGLLAGVTAAFLREFADRGIHTREELHAVLGIPVLGLIPHIQPPLTAHAVSRRVFQRLDPRRLLKGSSEHRLRATEPVRTSVHVHTAGAVEMLEPRLVSRIDPRNPVSEAYRGLRTNMTFAQPDAQAKSIVFTSPMPGDGKSTSATNLAITLAQQALKVLLVDADLRRGSLHSLFGKTRDPGLSNALIGAVSPEEAIRHLDLGLGDGAGGLDLLPTGTLPPNPAELLASARCSALVQRLAETYDIVIFDTPPMNLVTDAAVLGSKVDAVILVARAGSTTAEAVSYAMEQLQNVRANVIGTVLNDIDFERDARYAGYYGRYKYYQYYYASSK